MRSKSPLLCNIMRTILVVENNPELRENIEELLQLAGYRVISTSSQKEGLKESIKYKPDLILCDLLENDMMSEDLLENRPKNEEISSIPLVLISDDSSDPRFHNGYKANACLGKPFTYEELSQTIRHCLFPN